MYFEVRCICLSIHGGTFTFDHTIPSNLPTMKILSKEGGETCPRNFRRIRTLTNPIVTLLMI